MFKDREEAGQRLAEQLQTYKGKKDVIVIGLPRGGVVTAHAIAQQLNLPLDIIVTRKIGMPGEPEAAIGAITVGGERVFNKKLLTELSIEQDYIDCEVAKEIEEAKRRLTLYRGDRPPLVVKDKTILLVDDGVATGATMKAAILSAKAGNAKKIVLAVPVAPQSFITGIADDVDEVVCLYIPTYFVAVGMAYENFAQTEDEQVIELMVIRTL